MKASPGIVARVAAPTVLVWLLTGIVQAQALTITSTRPGAAFHAGIGLISNASAAFATESVTGSLQLGNERFALKFVFAVMEKGWVTADSDTVVVFLSDLPVPVDLRKDSMDWVYWAMKQAQAGALHGVSIIIDPATGTWDCGQVLRPEGLDLYSERVPAGGLRRLQFEPAEPIGDQVAARVSMNGPLSGTQLNRDFHVEAEFRSTLIRHRRMTGVLTGAAAVRSPQYKGFRSYLNACRKKDPDALRKAADPRYWVIMAEIGGGGVEWEISRGCWMMSQMGRLHKLSRVTIYDDWAELDFEGSFSFQVALSDGRWKLSR